MHFRQKNPRKVGHWHYWSDLDNANPRPVTSMVDLLEVPWAFSRRILLKTSGPGSWLTTGETLHVTGWPQQWRCASCQECQLVNSHSLLKCHCTSYVYRHDSSAIALGNWSHPQRCFRTGPVDWEVSAIISARRGNCYLVGEWWLYPEMPEVPFHFVGMSISAAV